MTDEFEVAFGVGMARKCGAGELYENVWLQNFGALSTA